MKIAVNLFIFKMQSIDEKKQDRLRDLCASVILTKSLESVKNLRIEIEKPDFKDSRKLINVDYIAVPVLAVLKEKDCWSVQEESLKCLLVALNLRGDIWTVFSPVIFMSIFTSAFKILTHPTDLTKVSDCSEECQILTLEVLLALLRNREPSFLLSLYQISLKGPLSHAVLLSLTIAKQSHNKRVRVLSLQLVQQLGNRSYFANSPSDEETGALLDVTRDIFTGFLPGILSTTVKIACGDYNQGHKVTQEALLTFFFFTTLILDNEYVESFIGANTTTLDDLTLRMGLNKKEEKKTIKRGTISLSWLLPTAKRVEDMLTKVCLHNRTHPHPVVRLHLSSSLQYLLLKCDRSLVSSTIISLETLCCLLSDSDSTVALEAAKVSLSRYSDDVVTTLQERVCEAVRKLPTLARSYADDSLLVSFLQQLSGSFSLLGCERTRQLLSIPNQLDRLVQNMAEILTQETNDDILTTHSSVNIPKDLSHAPRVPLLYLSSSLGMTLCDKIASKVVMATDHTHLLDTWLECYMHHTNLRYQLIQLEVLFIGEFSTEKTEESPSGYVHLQPEDAEEIVTNLMEVILTEEALLRNIEEATSGDNEEKIVVNNKCLIANLDNLCDQFKNPFNPYSRSSIGFNHPSDSPSILNRKINVLSVIASLQLVKECARMMGRRFRMFLSVVLCPVLRHCGSPLLLVGHVAHGVLESIALSCGYEGARGLVNKGANHYWFALSMQLKKPREHPHATQALKVALEYNTSGSSVLSSHMQKLLEELVSTLDSHHSMAPQQLLTLLRLFLACRKIKEEPIAEEMEEEKPAEEGGGPLATVISVYCKNRKDVQDALDEERKAVGEKMDIVTDEILKDIAEEKAKVDENIKELEEEVREKEEGGKASEEELPDEIRMIVEVLERCCFLLHTRIRSVSLILLDTLELGCQALVDRENTQLPILHKIWKPLMLRIKDTDTIVMLRSLLLLCHMVGNSGDFLRKRCIKELLPLIKDFLTSQSIASKNKANRTQYKLTYQYYSQYKLLTDLLPKLMTSLKLPSDELVHLLASLSHYLDTEQPEELVTACVSLFESLAQEYRQILWFVLAHLRAPFTLTPPQDHLKVIKMEGKYSQSQKLPPDVDRLFKLLS